MAEQQKYFEQEGIRAEMIYMRSPVAIPALSAGEIQYTTHFASVVRSAVKGFPVKVILWNVGSTDVFASCRQVH